MAYWGIALANGPHINFPLVPPPNGRGGVEEPATGESRTSGNCTQVEKDLIEALSSRYANPQPEDRTPLDQRVRRRDAQGLAETPHRPRRRRVLRRGADGPGPVEPVDARTAGQTPGTEEVLATLDEVLKLNVNHPMANHLYIHAMEASQHPGQAVARRRPLARRCSRAWRTTCTCRRTSTSASANWQQAIDWNAKAIEASRAFRKVAGPAEGLLIFYDAHNYHMLACGALMTGQRELAVEQIDAMVAGMPDDFVEAFSPAVEGFGAMPYEVRVRFGMWDEMLAMPQPTKPYMPFTNAFHHAARAIAFGAKGDTASARAEQKLWLEGLEQIPPRARLHNNKISDVATP